MGDKVELDRADLPIDDLLGFNEPEPPPPETEVALTPAAAPDDFRDLMEPEEGAAQPATWWERRPGWQKAVIMGVPAVVLCLLLAAGVGWWYGRGEEKKVLLDELPPGVVRGMVPKPDVELNLALKPFIVPLRKSAQGRILNVGVSLEAMDPDSRVAIGERTVALRDAIYRLLRDRPAVELQGAKQTRLLQSQIKAEVNHVLGQNLVHRVFFTQFVITG